MAAAVATVDSGNVRQGPRFALPEAPRRSSDESLDQDPHDNGRRARFQEEQQQQEEEEEEDEEEEAEEEEDDAFTCRPRLSVPFHEIGDLPEGVAHWEDLGLGAKSMQRDAKFLRSRTAAPGIFESPSDRGGGAAEDEEGAGGVAPTPSVSSTSTAGATKLLARYDRYCEQLGLVPNTGVRRYLQGGRAALETSVNLSHCGLKDVGIVSLGKILATSASVATLWNLSDNFLSDRGVLTVLSCLENNEDLEAIDFTNNVQIGSTSMKFLAAFLTQRTHVKEIRLEGTGIAEDARAVLYLQALRNEASDFLQYRRQLKTSPLLQHVESLARRFGLLEPHPQPCFEFQVLPGMVEDLWRKGEHFDLAKALYRRWAAENHRIKEAVRRAEERVRLEAKLEARRQARSHWALLVRLLLHAQRFASPEQELLFLLKLPMPTDRAEVEAQLTRLRRLLEQAEDSEESSRGASVLLERTRERIAGLEESLKRSQRLRRMIQTVALTNRFAGARIAQWEERVNEVLAMGLDGLKHGDLVDLASEVCELIERGKQLVADGMSESSLMQGLEEMLDKVLLASAAKKRVLLSAGGAFRKVKLMNRLNNAILEETANNALLVEAGLARLAARAENWYENLSIDEIAAICAEMEELLDAARIRHRGLNINPNILKAAEALYQKMGSHLSVVQAMQARVGTVRQNVESTLHMLQLEPSLAESGQRKLSLLTSELTQLLAEVANPNNGVRPQDSQVMVEELSKQQTMLECAEDVLTLGYEHFGIAGRELKDQGGKKKVSMYAVLPLHAAIRRMSALIKRSEDEEDEQEGAGQSVQQKSSDDGGAGRGPDHHHPDHPDLTTDANSNPGSVPTKKYRPKTAGREGSSEIQMLRMVIARLHQYGYVNICQLVPDENAIVTLRMFGERMQKLNIFDDSILTALFRIIQPFTFANFRRLLASPVISDESGTSTNH